MTTVIGFTGFARSGKDTAAGFLVERGFERLAFADALRDSLYALDPIVHAEASWEDDCYSDGAPCTVVEDYVRVQQIVDRIGWDRAKVWYPEIRQLLQRLGTEVGRALYGENFWVDRVVSKIKSGGRYVITDVRFPNECDAVHSIGGRVYRINRPGVDAVNHHASEAHVLGLPVDGVIPNTGSLDHFKELVLSEIL